MDKEKINVFIAALPRSGSTLLGMMLSNHSTIFHVGEFSYWGKLSPADTFCSCGVKGCSILLRAHNELSASREVQAIYEVCSALDIMEEPNKQYHSLSLPDPKAPIVMTRAELSKRMLHCCVGLEKIADVFRDITGKRIVVDNTKNISIAEFLVKRKGWRIIIMTRDLRGIANSNKNAGLRKAVARPLEMKIPVFRNFAKRALTLLPRGNVLLLRYEDLCLKPTEKLKDVCAFVDADFEESLLYFKRDRGHVLMGNRMRFDNNEIVAEDLAWTAGLNDEELFLLRSDRELAELYEQFGYSFP